MKSAVFSVSSSFLFVKSKCFLYNYFGRFSSEQYTVYSPVDWFQRAPLCTSSHWAFVPLQLMVTRLVQPRKASSPMCFNPSGRVMLSSSEQPRKALNIIWVTLSGITTFLRLTQPAKHCQFILLIPSGITMLSSDKQQQNA